MTDEFGNLPPDAIASDRDLVIFLNAMTPSGNGIAFVSVSRIGADVEIVASEEEGGDTSILLSGQQAIALARALTDALCNQAD